MKAVQDGIGVTVMGEEIPAEYFVALCDTPEEAEARINMAKAHRKLDEETRQSHG